MKLTDKQNYAKGLVELREWKHTLTIRPNFKLNEVTAYNLVQRLAKKIKSIIFFTMEKDRNSEHKHLHLLLDKQTTKEQTYKSLRMKKSSVTYSEPIRSKSCIASYVTKHLDNNNQNSYHDICLGE